MSDAHDDEPAPGSALYAFILRSGLEAAGGQYAVSGIPPANPTGVPTVGEIKALREATRRQRARLLGLDEPTVGRRQAESAGKLIGTVLVAGAYSASRGVSFADALGVATVSAGARVGGIASAEAFGVATVSAGGRVGGIASAVVEPAAADVEALTSATQALHADVQMLVAHLQVFVSTQQRHNPRWFETPAAGFTVAVLSLLIALLSLVGDRMDAAHDDQPAMPPASAPPAAPPPATPVDGRNAGSRSDGPVPDGPISARTAD